MARPFAHFAEGWRIVRGATVAAVVTLSLCAGAQNSRCGLSGIRHSAQLSYPPIAAVAYIRGDITLNARIAADGSVTSVDAITGPEMLKQAAKKYVASWQTNESDAVQVCSIVISFKVQGDADCYIGPSVVTMSDLQHFVVTTDPVQTCDPSATITFTRNRFLFFHWNSKPVRHINE